MKEVTTPNDTQPTVEDTAISKSSQLPHRFFVYSTFQKLVESATSIEDTEQNQLSDLLKDSLDSALVSLLLEIEKNESFTIAEA